DQRCGRCHPLDRVYKTAETPEEWSATVARMVSYAAGSAGAFQPGEDQQIIAYLSATQTPDAVNQRKAEAVAASAANGRVVTQRVSTAPDRFKPRTRYDSKMIGFISLVCLGMLALIVRRPARVAAANAKSDRTAGATQEPVGVVRTTSTSPGVPLILRLASIT